MKNVILLAALLGLACAILGCASKPMAKKESKNVYVLPKGMKLVNVTDRSYDIQGVLMRPMRAGEKAETYTWFHFEGGQSLIIKEAE